MGRSTISMAIFNSKLLVHQRVPPLMILMGGKINNLTHNNFPKDKFLQLLSALMAVRADARLTVFGLWLLCHLILGQMETSPTRMVASWRYDGYTIYIYIIIIIIITWLYIYIHNYIIIVIVVIYNYCLAMVHWNITNETRDKTGAKKWFRPPIGGTNWDGQLLGLTNEYHWYFANRLLMLVMLCMFLISNVCLLFDHAWPMSGMSSL